MSLTIKAECCGEVRRITMDNTTTLEDFNEKMKSVFGCVQKEDVEFDVFYRDQDGDTIRIGSTEELHHAFAICGEVLRVAIVPRKQSCKECPAPTQQRENLGSSLGLMDWSVPNLFGSFHDQFSAFERDPFFRDFGHWPNWEGRQLRLKQREEQLKHQREVEEKMKKQHEERAKKMDQFFEQEAERFRAEMDKRRLEAKKAPEDVPKKSSSGTVVVARPKYDFKEFGSWTPAHRSGPGWHSTHWGPVGYELHYYPPKEEEQMDTAKETTE